MFVLDERLLTSLLIEGQKGQEKRGMRKRGGRGAGGMIDRMSGGGREGGAEGVGGKPGEKGEGGSLPFFVVIRIVDALHERFAVVDLVRQGGAEKFPEGA